MSQSCPTLCDPMDYSMPGFPVQHQLSSLLKLMSIKSVKPSNHHIPCRSLILLPPIFPRIRVFSNESVPCIRWPKYWSFRNGPGTPRWSSGYSVLPLKGHRFVTKILPAAWCEEKEKEETKKEREGKKKEGRKGEMSLPVEEILKRNQEDEKLT